MIRTTQVNSLKQLKPTLSTKRQAVYNVIKYLKPATNRNIAKHLQWDINRVTGRVTELVNLGMVTSNGTYKDKQTNRTVTLWEVV